MTAFGRPPLGQVQISRPLSLAPANARGAVLEAGQVGDPVVLEDRPQGGLDFVLGQEVAQAELMRPPLADELVGHAAGADFADRRSSTMGRLW